MPRALGGPVTTDDTPGCALLRELFGDDAERALEELEHMGLDPAQIAEASGMSRVSGNDGPRLVADPLPHEPKRWRGRQLDSCA